MAVIGIMKLKDSLVDGAVMIRLPMIGRHKGDFIVNSCRIHAG